MPSLSSAPRRPPAALTAARTPARFTPVKSEPVLRILVSDLVGVEITRDSLAMLREDIADLSARLDDGEQTAETLPHRRAQLLLVIGFLRRLLDPLDLVEEFERELAPRPAEER